MIFLGAAKYMGIISNDQVDGGVGFRNKGVVGCGCFQEVGEVSRYDEVRGFRKTRV